MGPRSSSIHPYRAANEIAREGGWLRVPALAPSLPPRCAVCNEPATQRVKRTLHRIARPDSHLMFMAILLLCWPALLWLKPVFVDFGLCDRHARRIRLEWTVSVIAMIACFVGAFVFADRGLGAVTVLLLGTTAALLIVAARRRDVLRIEARERDVVFLSAPRVFLESFDELPRRGTR